MVHYTDPNALIADIASGIVDHNTAISYATDCATRENNPLWNLPVAFSLYSLGQYSEALDQLQRIESVCQNDCTWLVLAGMCARQDASTVNLAISYYKRALELEPGRGDVYYNLGNLYKDDNPEEAERLYRKSLDLDCFSATVWHNLGISLNNQSRHEEALIALRISLQLNPSVPDAWCNFGLSYFGLDLISQAERAFRHTISLDGQHAASHLNLGNALMSSLRSEEAIDYLEQGVKLEQSSTNSLFNLALANLVCGNYLDGWRYYEARFTSKDFNHVQVPTSGPRITSICQCPSTNSSDRLIVWSEQGMGDTIQFCRYLALLDFRGIPFIFLTRPSLVSLISLWTGLGGRVKELGSLDSRYETMPNVALMSLPYVFRTQLSTVPAPVPYFSTSSPAPAHLTTMPPPGALNIAFVWASNPDNKAMYKAKSMPADLLLPRFACLARLGLIALHSLQFGTDADQFQPWIHTPNFYQWNDKINDYSDTAFVIRQMDLVISVDTAVAHIAGALNRPTWLLLHYNADFRWLRDTIRSPWYPSMRLFRQEHRSDWSSVIGAVHSALDSLFLLDLSSMCAESTHKYSSL